VKRFISLSYFFFLDFEAVHRQSRKKGQVCPNEWTWRRLHLTSCLSNETFHQLRNAGSMPVRKPLEGLANSHGEKNEMKLGSEGKIAIVAGGSKGIGRETVSAARKI
jgi:hypothetical protein